MILLLQPHGGRSTSAKVEHFRTPYGASLGAADRRGEPDADYTCCPSIGRDTHVQYTITELTVCFEPQDGRGPFL